MKKDEIKNQINNIKKYNRINVTEKEVNDSDLEVVE